MDDSSLDKIIILKYNLLSGMAYKVTTWNQLDQYLVEWMFLSHTGTKFVNQKKKKLKGSSKDK